MLDHYRTGAGIARWWARSPPTMWLEFSTKIRGEEGKTSKRASVMSERRAAIPRY